jgi:hypothetical protein
MQMNRLGRQTFEELTYYVERGQLHPRKVERAGTAREVVQRS